MIMKTQVCDTLVAFRDKVVSLVQQELPLEPDKHNILICFGNNTEDAFRQLTASAQPNAFIYYLTPPGQPTAEIERVCERNPRRRN